MTTLDADTTYKIEQAICARTPMIVRPKDAPEVILVTDVASLALPLIAAFRGRAIDLPSREAFLNEYATTLGPVTWMPAGKRGFARLLLLAHEAHHVQLFYKNPVRYVEEYVADEDWRIRYEVECEAARWEVERWLTGRLPQPSVKKYEHGYAVPAAVVEPHAAAARQYLVSIDALSEGEYASHTGRDVIEAIREVTGLTFGDVSPDEIASV